MRLTTGFAALARHQVASVECAGANGRAESLLNDGVEPHFYVGEDHLSDERRRRMDLPQAIDEGGDASGPFRDRERCQGSDQGVLPFQQVIQCRRIRKRLHAILPTGVGACGV
jgi:hypothetical protein